MGISYDSIIESFLSKITEFELLSLSDEDRELIVVGFMKSSLADFDRVCLYDLFLRDDIKRELTDNFAERDIDEIVDIVSEGMLVRWLKTYVYKQELLENALNTRDFTTYSPAELLMRVGDAYKKSQKDYTQMIREYSFNHGDLSSLHL